MALSLTKSHFFVFPKPIAKRDDTLSLGFYFVSKVLSVK